VQIKGTVLIDLMIGSYASRRALALRGKVNLVPLISMLATGLVLSYLTSIFFDSVAAFNVTHDITNFGLRYIPAIASARAISPDPDRCSFVFTIQWFLAVPYAWVWLVGYCPFSRTIRVAAHRAPKPTYASLRGLGFMAFAIAWVSGDLTITSFPTFFHGGFITSDMHIGYVDRLFINGLTMPWISWFEPVSTVIIYWCIAYAIANYLTLFDLDDTRKSARKPSTS